MEQNASHVFSQLDVVSAGIAKDSILYIAIGSAAHMGRDELEPSQQQQIPPFLQELMRHSMQEVWIVLIDPHLESPPYVRRQGYQANIVEIRADVCYQPYIRDSCVDLTEWFRTMNGIAIEKEIFMVVQDYCGADIGKLAEYFDQDLVGHRDHIIYGISARSDVGCFLDLAAPEAQFVYRETCGRLSVLNPYEDLLACVATPDPIAQGQVRIYLERKRARLLEILRLARLDTKIDAKDVEAYGCANRSEAFQLLRTELLHYFSPKGDGESTVDRIMLDISLERDMYKWINIIMRNLHLG